jgi:hypothetical protein
LTLLGRGTAARASSRMGIVRIARSTTPGFAHRVGSSVRPEVAGVRCRSWSRPWEILMAAMSFFVRENVLLADSDFTAGICPVSTSACRTAPPQRPGVLIPPGRRKARVRRTGVVVQRRDHAPNRSARAHAPRRTEPIPPNKVCMEPWMVQRDHPGSAVIGVSARPHRH